MKKKQFPKGKRIELWFRMVRAIRLHIYSTRHWEEICKYGHSESKLYEVKP